MKRGAETSLPVPFRFDAAASKTMLRRSIAKLGVLTIFLLGSPQAYAQAAPEALVKARAAFAAAVAAKDVKAAADLTYFPLKNTVYSAPPTISQPGFAKQFTIYVEMKDCLKSEPLEAVAASKGQKSWAINCNGNVFHFALISGRWLHSEYENINE